MKTRGIDDKYQLYLQSHSFYHHALISCLLDAVHLFNHKFDPFLETCFLWSNLYKLTGQGAFWKQHLTEQKVFLFWVTGLGTLAPPKTEGQLSIYRQVKIVSINNYSLDIISKVIVCFSDHYSMMKSDLLFVIFISEIASFQQTPICVRAV